MVFSSRQKQIQDEINKYCETVIRCVNAFSSAVTKHCSAPDHEAMDQCFENVHSEESRADDIRRQIEVLMYSKSLFPESRGDMLELLEALDKVPNQAEYAVKMIREQNIIVPDFLEEDVNLLLDVCCRCVKALIDSVETLFSDYTNAAVAVGRVDELESEADHIESRIKTHVFSGNIADLHKILLRDLVESIAGITDRAQSAGDLIRIIIAKRGV